MRWTSHRLCLLAFLLLVSSIVAGFVTAAVLTWTTHTTARQQMPFP